MRENTLKLKILVLLPGVADERDQCITRLQELLNQRKGISQVHFERQKGQANFCIHYDADYVSLSQVERWAREAGDGWRNMVSLSDPQTSGGTNISIVCTKPGTSVRICASPLE